MYKYFAEVKSVEELRQKYRELLKKYHPDNEGGSVEITQEINSEYDRLFEVLSKERSANEETPKYDYKAENDAFKEILNKIIHVAMGEQESNERPALATTIKNMKQYDTIILGYAGGIIGLN